MNDRERDLRFMYIRICGCVACHLFYRRWVAPQVHHLNFGDKHGGKRLGDAYTIGLCPWHHLGHPMFDWRAGHCRARLGPSWEIEPNEFRKTFGAGADLLEFQDALIAGYLQQTALTAALEHA